MSTHSINENSLQIQHNSSKSINNEKFIRYYKDINKLFPDSDSSWESFMDNLATPLPITIWINDTDPLAKQASEFFLGIKDTEVGPISWYPIPGMAWRLSIHKKNLRRDENFKMLHKNLKHYTSIGLISRQEEVSMIPPFLLNIQSEDVCLDACASPGSKTAQMLVALGRHKIKCNSMNENFDYHSPGCVVANELDLKRSNLLVFQTKRLKYLFPFAIFTNCDARYMPEIQANSDKTMQYDKVLCDVVCSGDGTIRKSPLALRHWKYSTAIGLQIMQIDIAMRSAVLLKRGGRMVYSTCSLNPIENEAVVQQIIVRSSGKLSLVDIRNCATLPMNLKAILKKFAPGMKTWTVVGNDGRIIDEYRPSTVQRECFPIEPSPYSLDLSYCLRILPHHCQGGGFFIAVIQKEDDFIDLKYKDEENYINRNTKPGTLVYPEYNEANKEYQKWLVNTFNLINFPTNQVMNRQCNTCTSTPLDSNALNLKESQLYFVSATVKYIIENWFNSIPIIASGMRFMVRDQFSNGWRLSSNAAPLVYHYMDKKCNRHVYLDLNVAMPMLLDNSMKDIVISSIENGEIRNKHPQLSTLVNISLGPLIITITNGKYGPITTSGYRARTRIQLLVSNEDMPALLTKLGIPLP